MAAISFGVLAQLGAWPAAIVIAARFVGGLGDDGAMSTTAALESVEASPREMAAYLGAARWL